MAYNPKANAYSSNKIMTATPAELTLMLYEGAVKFCNIALMGLEKNDYETVNTNIQKARAIIVELNTTLDHKYPVAKDFEQLYDYIFALLVEANINKDADMLTRALDEIRDLRDIWKKIMGQTKGPQLVLDTN